VEAEVGHFIGSMSNGRLLAAPEGTSASSETIEFATKVALSEMPGGRQESFLLMKLRLFAGLGAAAGTVDTRPGTSVGDEACRAAVACV
jgi:hypothetical protein